VGKKVQWVIEYWVLGIGYWVTRKFGTVDMGKNLYGTVLKVWTLIELLMNL